MNELISCVLCSEADDNERGAAKRQKIERQSFLTRLAARVGIMYGQPAGVLFHSVVKLEGAICL